MENDLEMESYQYKTDGGTADMTLGTDINYRNKLKFL